MQFSRGVADMKQRAVHGCHPCGREFLVFGLWSLVFGLWSLVFGLWSLVFGLWSLDKTYFLACDESRENLGSIIERISKTKDPRPKTKN
jgi:hypothetical protein